MSIIHNQTRNQIHRGNKTHDLSQHLPSRFEKDIAYVKKIIDEKNPDHVKLRYYPSYKTKSDHEIQVCGLEKSSDEKMNQYLTSNRNITIGRYIEYGLKDTFVRIATTNDQTTRLFFRRMNFIFTIDEMPGIFVIEIYNMCEEEDLPFVVNYDHNTTCEAITHVLGDQEQGQKIRICHSKIRDDSLTERLMEYPQNTVHKKTNEMKEVFDINIDLDIDNVARSFNEFINQLSILKKKINF